MRLRALTRAVGRALVLTPAWLVSCLPLVTWMAASAALVHSLDRAGRPGDAGALAEFRLGWRRHWRGALPWGAVSLVVLVGLLANLLFLTGQAGPAAFLLLVGTLLLLTLWGMAVLSLVPALVVLAHLPRREQVRVGVLLAFRHPVWSAGLLLAAVLVATTLAQVWAPLAVLAAPVVGYLALRVTRRHLDAV